MRGATPSVTVVQPSYGWLDLGDLEDVILYTDVREATGSPTLTFQTAASLENAAFVNLTAALSLTAGTITTTSAIASTANVPPLRYLRWVAGSPSGDPWDLTFRVWVAAYGWR